jgi:hypothetical protein
VTRDWLLWGLLRALLVVIILGWLPWPEQVNDLQIYADWAADSLQHGQFPTDERWQYPPLAGPTLLLGWLLPGERLGYVALFLAFDAAIMGLLSHQAARTGRSGGRRLWALAALVTGPLLLARFDVVPTALAVAAVLLAAQPLASGALAATGAWVKAWPVLVLAGLRRSDLPRGLLGALGASALIAGILVFTMQDPLSFLSGQTQRGLQIESVAAWPFLVARAAGADVTVAYQYGAHEVVATGVPFASGATAVVTVLLLGLVAAQRLRGALEHVAAADVVLASVLFTVVASRVFSGQYLVWLLGLAAACLGDPATRMRRCVALVVASGVATQLVYPWLYTALLEGHPAALVVQTLRVALIVAATVVAVRVLVLPSADQPSAT